MEFNILAQGESINRAFGIHLPVLRDVRGGIQVIVQLDKPAVYLENVFVRCGFAGGSGVQRIRVDIVEVEITPGRHDVCSCGGVSRFNRFWRAG